MNVLQKHHFYKDKFESSSRKEIKILIYGRFDPIFCSKIMKTCRALEKVSQTIYKRFLCVFVCFVCTYFLFCIYLAEIMCPGS